MTYKSVERGYVFWQEALLLPMKKKHPDEKQKFFRKEIDFEDAPNYWEYVCEDGMWNVYYVKRGVNRRMAACNIGKFAPSAIIARIKEKDITVTDCNRIEEHKSRPLNRIPLAGVFWSIDYDGKSVYDLMEDKPKMPYADIKAVIRNEGGSIDADGIIHKGTCTGN